MANGSNTEASVYLTYSSVVSSDSVRLEFLIIALNDLDVVVCGNGNAYFNAPCKWNIFFKAGTECGEHQGKVMIVVRALYDLKTSATSWQLMIKELSEKNLHFKSTLIKKRFLY